MTKTIFFSILLLLFHSNCNDLPALCINCDEQLTCNGFNKIKLCQDRDYTFDSDCFDSSSWSGYEIRSKCGISFYIPSLTDYGSGIGGGGDTYYGDISSIHLTSGWTGQTDRGLELGDPLERFSALYPESEIIYESLPSRLLPIDLIPQQAQCENENIHLKAYPDEQGKIFYIILFHSDCFFN